MQTPSPRLYCIFAREAPVAAIFRRGPSKQVQLIKWRTDEDVFEPGQWLKGRIYERRADLSPDGKLLVYFAADHRYLKGPATWTAVSKLPYLTALAFYPKGDCWAGGGLFSDYRTVLLNGPHKSPRIVSECPLKFGSLGLPMGEDDPINESRLERDGWMLEQRLVAKMQGYSKGFVTSQKRIRRKRRGDRTLESMDWIERWSDRWEFTLTTEDDNQIPLTGANWADFDQRGRVCYTRDGAIHVIDSLSHEPRELCNFSSSTFTEMPPPEWATKW